MPTAILIDGAFFVKRFRKIEPDHAHDAKRAADFAFQCALAHLEVKVKEGKSKEPKRDLYRIFFYDCPPLDKKLQNPISKKGGRTRQSHGCAPKTVHTHPRCAAGLGLDRHRRRLCVGQSMSSSRTLKTGHPQPDTGHSYRSVSGSVRYSYGCERTNVRFCPVLSGGGVSLPPAKESGNRRKRTHSAV